MSEKKQQSDGSGLLVLALFIIFAPGLVGLVIMMLAYAVMALGAALTVIAPIAAVGGLALFGSWVPQQVRFRRERRRIENLQVPTSSSSVFLTRKGRDAVIEAARPAIPTPLAFGGLAVAVVVGAVALSVLGVQAVEAAEEQAKADRRAERVVALVDLNMDQVLPPKDEEYGFYLIQEAHAELEFCTEVSDPKPLNSDTHVVTPRSGNCFSVWTVEELAAADAYDAAHKMSETAQYVLGDLGYARDVAVGPDNTLIVPMTEYEAYGILRDPGFQARVGDAHLTAQVSGDTLVFTFPAEKGGEL